MQNVKQESFLQGMEKTKGGGNNQCLKEVRSTDSTAAPTLSDLVYLKINLPNGKK